MLYKKIIVKDFCLTKFWPMFAEKYAAPFMVAKSDSLEKRKEYLNMMN